MPISFLLYPQVKCTTIFTNLNYMDKKQIEAQAVGFFHPYPIEFEQEPSCSRGVHSTSCTIL